MSGKLWIRELEHSFAGQDGALFRVPELTLQSGEQLGLAGPSGAGKTTFLHCLAGIEKPSAGQIVWGDTDITTLTSTQLDDWRRTQIGLVFQEFHLVEGLTVLDNVLLPASFSGWRVPAALRDRGRALLERVGLVPLEKRDAALLSRGERQRVAVARALLFAPAIVLADEPTASLDPFNRAQIAALLLDVAREHGATLVVVSHETELLGQLNRCCSLHHGQLHSIDCVQESISCSTRSPSSSLTIAATACS
jgi:putative ABC transport system ATP-binding protein